MSAQILKAIILLFCGSSVASLSLDRLADDCLKGRPLHATEDLKCSTGRKVGIQRIRERNQTFYCIKYEKKTGDRREFEVLSFDLHEDYELKYTGANVVSNEQTSPEFKLYDTRTRSSYKGKIAISSENPDFDIRSVKINAEDEICYSKGKQIWPLSHLNEDSSQASTSSFYLEQEMSSTTNEPSSEVLTAKSPSIASCGDVKKIENFGNHVSLPSRPGQFPWTVAIYRFFNEDEESYYKCGGTIVDENTIVTSVNCLLEDGLLLKSSDLQVYASPFSLSAKRLKSKTFNIAEFVTHESYDFHLNNNVALVKLSHSIEFNDYIQPICLPHEDFVVADKLIGKFAGFGKSSSTHQPKSDLLAEAEYQVEKVYNESFTAENTSGNSQISDIGGGLYFNDTNRWTLGGIMSKRVLINSLNYSVKPAFVFTNVAKYLDWINQFSQKI